MGERAPIEAASTQNLNVSSALHAARGQSLDKPLMDVALATAQSANTFQTLYPMLSMPSAKSPLPSLPHLTISLRNDETGSTPSPKRERASFGEGSDRVRRQANGARQRTDGRRRFESLG